MKEIWDRITFFMRETDENRHGRPNGFLAWRVRFAMPSFTLLTFSVLAVIVATIPEHPRQVPKVSEAFERLVVIENALDRMAKTMGDERIIPPEMRPRMEEEIALAVTKLTRAGAALSNGDVLQYERESQEAQKHVWAVQLLSRPAKNINA